MQRRGRYRPRHPGKHPRSECRFGASQAVVERIGRLGLKMEELMRAAAKPEIRQ